MHLVLKRGVTAAPTNAGGVRVGGGDVGAVGGLRLLGLIEPLLQLAVAPIQLGLELAGVHHGVVGRVGFHQAAVHEQLAAVHQAALNALTHDTFEELLEGFGAPARTRL